MLGAMTITIVLFFGALAIETVVAFCVHDRYDGRRRGGLELRMSGVARNSNLEKLVGGYLFPEIVRRRQAYRNTSGRPVISLGIGDTTLPIPPHILNGLVEGARKLGSEEGYTGYGPELGQLELRTKIASVLYHDRIRPDEVFVSDGAQCDIMRLQQMFGNQVISAVQDPSYPAYVDSSVIMGQTGTMDTSTNHYRNILYLPSTPQNNFFPTYHGGADILYWCSPNNPTGVATTKQQLQEIVNVCHHTGTILVFDAAYAPFIRTPGIPKSIFEIDGAREVAIEVNSFSKYAGFTGVRLGWTVIPSNLTFNDGTKVQHDFKRVMSTAFNGASIIAQAGGLACLDQEGIKEIDGLIDYYLENAKIIKNAMKYIGFTVFGGIDAPYVFVKLNKGNKSSWNMFNEILEKAQVVTIPGAGFGPAGEGYLRLSAFAPKDSVIEACKRLKEALA